MCSGRDGRPPCSMLVAGRQAGRRASGREAGRPRRCRLDANVMRLPACLPAVITPSINVIAAAAAAAAAAAVYVVLHPTDINQGRPKIRSVGIVVVTEASRV